MTPRDELKQEFFQYMIDVAGISDAEIWNKAFGAVQKAVYNSQPIDKDLQKHFKKQLKEIGLQVGDEFYYQVVQSFSPRHYYAISNFIKRLEVIEDAEESELAKLEVAEGMYLEDQREIYADDYNYGDVPGEVIVYDDRIEVTAFGFQEGFKDQLPAGGKYQGKGSGTWHYPNNDEYRKVFGTGMYCNMPILFATKNEVAKNVG